jgi:hypothetical protein
VLSIAFVLLVIAFACFAVAAIQSQGWNRLVAAGLALWVASMLVR